MSALRGPLALTSGPGAWPTTWGLTPPPDLPSGTVYTSVVPYSFFHVSELSGYAAGNRAPQFYQALWDLPTTSVLRREWYIRLNYS